MELQVQVQVKFTTFPDLRGFGEASLSIVELVRIEVWPIILLKRRFLQNQ